MGLLTKLKSLLGLADDRSGVRRTDSGVTIEREPDESVEPDVDVESAVKGVDTREESLDTADGDTASQRSTSESTADVGAAGVEEDGSETTGEAEPATAVEEAEPATADSESEADQPETTESEPAEESEVSEPAEESEVSEPAEESEVSEPAEESESEPAEPEEAGGERDAVDVAGEGEPLEDIKGIGPAYAERLREAGVDDVAGLARADAGQLAERTDLSAKRISTWIDRANAR